MLNFIKADFAKALVAKVSKSNDHKTTILGFAGSALIASNLDWGKLVNGDSAEIGKAVGAVIMALFSFYTNKPEKEEEKK